MKSASTLFLALSMSACRAVFGADAVPVACSLPPIASLVDEIAGAPGCCRAVVPPGADPHSFEPAPKDLAALSSVRLYFSGGMDFERVLAERLAARNLGARFVQLGGGEDPHGWLSPQVLAQWADCVAAALAECGVEGAAERGKNAKKRFAALLEEGRKALEESGVTAFATVHPAFGPFADAFGLRQIALESEGKEPGPRSVSRVRAQMEESGAVVMFVRNAGERRKAEAFCRGLGARLVEVRPEAPDFEGTIRELLLALAGGRSATGGAGE